MSFAALPVRIPGVLLHDAVLHRMMGAEPHLLIDLHIQPAAGLPCFARVDVGTDTAAQMAAEAQHAGLRKHCLVSVACDGLSMPRTDHGHAEHVLLNAHGLVITNHRVIETYHHAV